MLTKDQKDRLKRLRTSLDVSKRWRQEMASVWEEYIEQYTGRGDRDIVRQTDPPLVNLINSTVQIAVAASTVEDPYFEVIPRMPQFAKRAPLTEAVLAATWDRVKAQEQYSEASIDRFTVGHGWIKHTWERVEIPGADPDPDVVAKMVDNIMMLSAVRNIPMEDLPDPDMVEAYVRRKSVDTVVNQPVVKRVSPFDIWMDPEATCYEDIRWIAQRINMSLDDVKSEERFNRNVRYKVPAMSAVRPNPDAHTDWFFKDRPVPDDPGLERAAIWELYDIERRELTVWADGMDDDEILWGPQSIEQTLGHPHPFVFLPCIKVPDQLYPMGFVELVAPLQQELNEQRLELALARREMIPKYVAKANVLTDDAKDALESGERGVIVEVESDDSSLNEVLQQLPIPQIQQALFAHGDTVLLDMDRVTGVSALERGVGLQGQTTATEVNAVTGYVSARARMHIRATKRAMEESARRIISLMQANMDTTEWVKLQAEFGLELPEPLTPDVQPIQDPRNKAIFYPFNGADLGGEWEFKIAVDTGTVDGPARRQQRALQMMQTLMPLAQAGVVNLQELLKYALRNGFGITDPERFLAPMAPMQAPPTGQMGGMGTPGGQPALPVGQGLPPGMEQMLAQAGQMGGLRSVGR